MVGPKHHLAAGHSLISMILPEGHRSPITREGVTCLADAALPTRFGDFRIAILRVGGTGPEVVVIWSGRLIGAEPPLVRLHSECLTGEVFGSLRCDCGEQLAAALRSIAAAGRVALLYLRQEGRGIGLANKIRAYALQDLGLDTVDANLALGLPPDRRDYGAAVAALRYLGVRQVRLLTNNPRKCQALERNGIAVVERVPLAIEPNPTNLAYLRTKEARLGHFLGFDHRVDEPVVSNEGPGATGP
ncbi:MAG: GTP cyclohydrolase II [Chloroflexota bacterium]